jgi:anti-sigma factor RsiW
MSTDLQDSACPEYEARLEDFLSGELSGTEKREVADHIKSCVGCKAALDQVEACSGLLRLMEPTGEPGPAFSRVVMARIRSEQEAARQPRGFWQPFVSLAWRFAATAALAVIAMVTYDRTVHEAPNSSNAAVAQQTPIRDLFTSEADRVPANPDDVIVMVAETNHGNR